MSACDVVREEAAVGSAEFGRLPDVTGASNTSSSKTLVLLKVSTRTLRTSALMSFMGSSPGSTRLSKEVSTVVSDCGAVSQSPPRRIVIALGSLETLCAIGLLTLDEMEPHRERSIAENGHRVGMFAASLANALARRRRFFDLRKDPRGVSTKRVVTRCHQDFCSSKRHRLNRQRLVDLTGVLGIVLRVVFCLSNTQAVLRVEAPSFSACHLTDC